MPELFFFPRGKCHDGVIWCQWGLGANAQLFGQSTSAAPLAPYVQFVIAGLLGCSPTDSDMYEAGTVVPLPCSVPATQLPAP